MDNIPRIVPSDAARAAAAVAPVAPDPKALFHPVEHAILRAYFRMRPLKSGPPAVEFEDGFDGAPEDRPYVGIDYELAEFGLANAVARLCLGAIQQRLPSWGYVKADGTVVIARKAYARRAAAIEAKPVYLFTLNWADSGPGFSWPVAYHATWIPGYERWVVTASADSPDTWGCSDIAVGWFRGNDIPAGAGRVIRREWRGLLREGDQPPWAYLFDTGLVTKEEAHAWRARVWRGHEEL